MKFRLVPVAFLLTACALSSGLASAPPAGVVPKPWTPKPGSPAAVAPAARTPRRPTGYAPDTTNYLADTTWLARVGPRVIRAGEYTTQYANAYVADRPTADSSGRVQFLTTLINKNLLGLEAQELNRPLSFEDRATLRETEERALSDVFFQRFVAERAFVTDAEVQEFVDQRGLEAHFRHIRLPDKETAERVRARLVGAHLPWAVAVQQFSLDKPTPGNPDGDVGWVARTAMPDVAGLALFRLQPGGYSEVLQSSGGGYEVAQMVERRAVKAPPKTALLSFVRNQIKQMHVTLLTDSIQTSLLEQVGMVFDTANVRFASSHFSKALNVSHQGYNTTMEINEDLPNFSAEDTARVLARWRSGGRYSLGQLQGWYSGMSPWARPDLTFPSAMTAAIATVVLEPERATLARERGLSQDPEVVATVESKRERIMVEHIYQDSVATGLTVSREERLAYYDQHKPDFFSFPAVDYAFIYRRSRAGADSIKRALDSGAMPQDIIAADSLRGQQTGSIRHSYQQDGGPYHRVLYEELRPGKSTTIGPDSEGSFAVIQLIHYDPGHQLAFKEVESLADEVTQNAKSEARLNAWLARIREKYPVEWRPELVARIRLTEAPK